MTFVLIGFKLWSTILATLTIIMFLIDLMGLMYLWNISLNALSLVNLCAVSNLGYVNIFLFIVQFNKNSIFIKLLHAVLTRVNGYYFVHF